MQFPDYFGNNWNALDECLNDLSWLSATKFLIVITNSEKVLFESTEEDCLAFGKLLAETCEFWSKPYEKDKEWGHPGRPFHVVMQCENVESLAKFGDVFK